MGGAFLITASHVWDAIAQEPDRVVVGFDRNGQDSFLRIAEAERLGADTSILRLETEIWPWAIVPKWRDDVLPPLTTVRATGYAFGMHYVGSDLSLVQRSFQGQITCCIARYIPVGGVGEPYPIYELSFPAPRGLSGAPLLIGQPSKVCGVMTHSTESSMEIYRQEETTTSVEGNEIKSESFIRDEVLILGAASRSTWLLDRHSQLLGQGLRRHIEENGLL